MPKCQDLLWKQFPLHTSQSCSSSITGWNHRCHRAVDAKLREGKRCRGTPDSLSCFSYHIGLGIKLGDGNLVTALAWPPFVKSMEPYLLRGSMGIPGQHECPWLSPCRKESVAASQRCWVDVLPLAMNMFYGKCGQQFCGQQFQEKVTQGWREPTTLLVTH